MARLSHDSQAILTILKCEQGRQVRRDPLTKKQRSQQMSLVRSKDTSPELRVRHALSTLGYRYRLHARNIPGKPDIVFKRLRKLIFVHGCFWHRHRGCQRTRTPKSRIGFWTRKFAENVTRDRSTRKKLLRQGWRVLVIWECITEKPKDLQEKLLSFLGARA